MPIEVDGEIYYTAAEAARDLGISRDTFHRNVEPQLQSYKFGVLRRIYYKKSDLDKFKGIHAVENKQVNNG